LRTLETPRLTLVPQMASHADEMFAVLSDPQIYLHENQPPPSMEWLRQRFARLESRASADGKEQWLNWVIRMPSGALIGYVQATLDGKGRAAVAYELSSAFWGQGLAHGAVATMIEELAGHYRVRLLSAVLKCNNQRSRRLLERLGFALAAPAQQAGESIEPDEMLMLRTLSPTSPAPG
jgi:RimJ/RimL family protein N-acetyltransferase